MIHSEFNSYLRPLECLDLLLKSDRIKDFDKQYLSSVKDDLQRQFDEEFAKDKMGVVENG